VPILLVALGLVGLAVGSFLNAVAHRLAIGMSIVTPRSHCPRCSHPIRVRHNVPVLGWLLLRGRCYDCKSPISIRYLAVELFVGMAYAAAGWLLATRQALAVLPLLLFVVTIATTMVLLRWYPRASRLVPTSRGVSPATNSFPT
jgi:leader peptidase (prepilin peptidase) / N-methyltransferase